MNKMIGTKVLSTTYTYMYIKRQIFLGYINHYKINYLYQKINFSLTHIDALSSDKICSKAEGIKVTTKSWLLYL